MSALFRNTHPSCPNNNSYIFELTRNICARTQNIAHMHTDDVCSNIQINITQYNMKVILYFTILTACVVYNEIYKLSSLELHIVRKAHTCTSE